MDIYSILRDCDGLSEEEIAEVLKDWDLIEDKGEKSEFPF